MEEVDPAVGLPWWIYVGIAVHVLIAIVFITSLLYYHYKANTLAVQVATKLDRYLKEYGYDAAPFLPEWYNDLSTVVKMSEYHPKTVCVVVVSNCDMFEKTLPAYLAEHDPELTRAEDCVDSCTKHFMAKAAQDLFPNEPVDILYDWELQPGSRLPKVNMSTAGHAAGIAFFNLPEKVENPPWGEKRVFGCSISPKYGGHFGYRAVLVFKDLRDDDIPYLEPHDAVEGREQKIKLIEGFNRDYKDPVWRDIIYTDKRYGDDQIDYFNTIPGKRVPKMRSIMSHLGHASEDRKDL